MIMFFDKRLQSNSHFQWKKLTKATLWQYWLPLDETLDKKKLKQLKLYFLREDLMKHRSEPDSQLPSVCRSSLCIDFLLCYDKVSRPSSVNQKQRFFDWQFFFPTCSFLFPLSPKDFQFNIITCPLRSQNLILFKLDFLVCVYGERHT